jgi:hypothetical protein
LLRPSGTWSGFERPSPDDPEPYRSRPLQTSDSRNLLCRRLGLPPQLLRRAAGTVAADAFGFLGLSDRSTALTSSRAINDGDSQIWRSMPRTVDSVYPLTRRAIPVCNRVAVARTNFRCAALKPYRLKMPPHNCETRQASILVFHNNQCKERRFLPGLKAWVSTPNI